MTSMTTNVFSPEVRDRAVRIVLDCEHGHPSRWAPIVSIAAKIGCTGRSLNEWLKQVERVSGRAPGVTSEAAARLKALERNVSTALIQPGLEFRLGYEALFERRGAVRVRHRLV